MLEMTFAPIPLKTPFRALPGPGGDRLVVNFNESLNISDGYEIVERSVNC